ncbi:MAG: hypothetical protein KZQ83_02525 [gamma proteobacterium symbiont of Taylorina sp.]|nr:hypothetical protein [gamma proteobacterium symbiont of Taylorina sp.]
MEFFKEVESSNLDVKDLRNLLSIKNLPLLCKSINSVILDEQKKGIIYCLWGEFEVNREKLKYGIRFSLPNCPNALTWTITMDVDRANILIHCTINKSIHDTDFIESIEEFISDWSNGILLYCK